MPNEGREAVKKKVRLPVSRTVLEALVERNLSLVEGIIDDTRKQMVTIFTDGITNGKSPRDIAKELRKLGYNERRAETIARTETMYALNTGVVEQYKESGIEYVKWLASYDDRTCDDHEVILPDGSVEYGGCAAMDGKIFRVDNCPDMPAHPNCRCSWAASRGPEDW